MASGRNSALFFYLFFFFFSCAAISQFPSVDASNKVRLDLYYETLCPYCTRFIVNHLYKIFENGLIDIVDLNLVPYGNARVGPDGSISCQHGPDECLLNTVEACVIHTWPDTKQHFKFVYCVEKLVFAQQQSQWETCFKETDLDSKTVMDCNINGQGLKLALAYGAETDALQPPHRFVPWVVVNGKPLYDAYETFDVEICKAYNGVPPRACKGLPTISL